MLNLGFQPLRFKICEETSSCDCGDESCNQLALFTDKFSFQIGDSYRFLDIDLISNGDFSSVVGAGSVAGGEVANWSAYNPGGGADDWNASTNQACAQGNPLSQIMYQTVAITDCKCYRHIFDIKTDIPEDCTLSILLDDGSDTWSEVITTYTEFQAQDDVEVAFCADQNWTRIGYQITGGADCGETEYCIDNIELREYDIQIDIYDCCDDSYVDTIEDCDIKFGVDNVIVQGVWSDYVSVKKCYKFLIPDLEIVRNGEFPSDLEFWDQTSTGLRPWDWNSNAARCDIQSRGQVSEVISQDLDIYLGNCSVDLNFDIDSAGQTAAPVNLYINGVIVQTFTYTGSDPITYTYTIDDLEEVSSIGFSVEDDSAAGQDFFLDNVSLILDPETDCICVASDHPFCTQVLSSRHSEDTSQFDFETDTDFRFWMRLNSRLVNPKYPNEVDIYISSFGVNNLFFSRGGKVWDYQINRVPEYMWDAIQNMWNFDTVRIDNIQYVKLTGDIEPTWNRGNTKLASSTLEVKKQTEDRVAN